jgi:hypothetical protein
MLDGIDGGNTGVVLLHDGAMRGGDAHFDYQGAYASSNGKWKGELINHEHTPSEGARLLFGGYEVGVGFSGTYSEGRAVATATALVGKRSVRFSAVLKKMIVRPDHHYYAAYLESRFRRLSASARRGTLWRPFLACRLAASFVRRHVRFGTNPTNCAGLTMSVDRGGPEVAFRGQSAVAPNVWSGHALQAHSPCFMSA